MASKHGFLWHLLTNLLVLFLVLLVLVPTTVVVMLLMDWTLGYHKYEGWITLALLMVGFSAWEWRKECRQKGGN